MALSAIPLATVRMVPSLGFITALYAVSVPRTMALARVVVSMASTFLISLVKPLNSWERITPEFPLAPRREPEEMALARSFILGFSRAATSLAAAIMVRLMLVPVSPSGTGNTFSSLIHSFLASSSLAAARNARCKLAASIQFIPTGCVLLNQSLSHLPRIR